MHEEAKINNLLIKLKILEKSQLAEHKGRKTEVIRANKIGNIATKTAPHIYKN